MTNWQELHKKLARKNNDSMPKVALQWKQVVGLSPATPYGHVHTRLFSFCSHSCSANMLWKCWLRLVCCSQRQTEEAGGDSAKRFAPPNSCGTCLSMLRRSENHCAPVRKVLQIHEKVHNGLVCPFWKYIPSTEIKKQNARWLDSGHYWVRTSRTKMFLSVNVFFVTLLFSLLPSWHCVSTS